MKLYEHYKQLAINHNVKPYGYLAYKHLKRTNQLAKHIENILSGV